MTGPQLLSALSLGLAFICCYGGITPLCAQTGAIPEKESDAIHGTVLNTVTHEPIGRALVYSSDNRFATMTDASGHFEFKFPPSEAERKNGVGVLGGTSSNFQAGAMNGPSSLLARKPGFLPDDSPQDTQLNLGQKEVTIYLVPEALIVGKVTLGASEGSDKIQVELYRRQIQDGRARWNSVSAVTTRSNGEFRFSDLPPGTYKVFTHELLDRDPLTFNPRGQLYGYPPVYFPTANNFASGGAIQLSAGITFHANLSPMRREYYPVEVGIQNMAEGVPAEVTVSAAGQKGRGYSLGYRPEDQKIQGLLPDGTYALEVSSFGPTGATGIVNITVNGAPATGQSVTLVPNASINVNLTEEFTGIEDNGNGSRLGSFSSIGVAGDKQPRGRYLQVSLEPTDEIGQRRGPSLRQPSGPEDESLVLENVAPGPYWVRVNSSRGYAASVSCGGTDLLHHPLVVPPGGSTPPMELTMRDDGAQIDGVIENAPALPGPSFTRSAQTPAQVYLLPLPDSTGQFRQLWVSPDGNFSSAQIPPGDYRVLAFDRPQPELEYRNDEAMSKYDSEGQVIRLLPGQKAHLQLRLISGND
jgi:hypothetical protein